MEKSEGVMFEIAPNRFINMDNVIEVKFGFNNWIYFRFIGGEDIQIHDDNGCIAEAFKKYNY